MTIEWLLTDDVDGPGGVDAERGDVGVLRATRQRLAVVVQRGHEAHHAHRQIIPELLLPNKTITL